MTYKIRRLDVERELLLLEILLQRTIDVSKECAGLMQSRETTLGSSKIAHIP